MGLSVIAPPGALPIALADAKAHLRVDHDEEDAVIARLISSATERVEAWAARPLIARTYRWTFDRFPYGAVSLPVGPLLELFAIRVRDAGGAAVELEPERYAVDPTVSPARLYSVGAWPAVGAARDGVEIEFQAGYGLAPENTPASLREGVLALVAHAYERRDPGDLGAEQALRARLGALIAPFAEVRL